VDGNNILEVYHTITEINRQLRVKPRPVLLECVTFRMRGHEEASGTKYYPDGLQDKWSVKDPVTNYETWLLASRVIDQQFVDQTRAAIKNEIDTGLEKAFADERPVANTKEEVRDLFAPYSFVKAEPGSAKSEKRLIDAISDGLRESMKKHDNLVLMGQDIAEYGGVFKITDGFVKEFGKERVRNTPLCESAIVGTALGLSISGMKAMMEMQFADFVTEGFNQIVNNLAKIHWRWGQNADVVIRMPTGAGVAAGPFHSQSNEAWFFHVPGLKIVYPSNPYDAKGLLIASFEDPNPVLFFEHKALYRSIHADIPDGYYNVEIGKAAVVSEGKDLSVITYGYGVHWAKEILAKHPEISADVIDLRTLLPLDTETIFASVRKTGKAIVLHEDTLTGGIGGELSALINEHCFAALDAPVVRVASLDTPVPFAPELEQNFLPVSRFEEKLLELHKF
jgi:2-oxoisovalerate dehydrogenase E1 component